MTGLHFEPTTAGEGGYWVAGGVALAGAGAPFRPLVCQQRDNVPPDGHHRLSPASKSAFFPRPTVIAPTEKEEAAPGQITKLRETNYQEF